MLDVVWWRRCGRRQAMMQIAAMTPGASTRSEPAPAPAKLSSEPSIKRAMGVRRALSAGPPRNNTIRVQHRKMEAERQQNAAAQRITDNA